MGAQIEILQLEVDELRMGRSHNDDENTMSECMEDENARLHQTMNELEIDLMRERNSKETVQEKLVELQLLYSEVASQRVFGDIDQSEMSDLKRLSSLNLNESLNQDRSSIEFKQSLEALLEMDDVREVFRDILIEYLPEEDYSKMDEVIDPANLLSVCKSMSGKIKSLENAKQCIVRSPIPCAVQDALVDFNVTDVSFVEKENQSMMTECLLFPQNDSREMSNEAKSIVYDQQIAVSIESETINPAKLKVNAETQTIQNQEKEMEAVIVANTGCTFP